MTTSAKRARQREARVARLEAERLAAQKAGRRRRVITGAVIAAIVLGVVVLLSVLGGNDGNDTPPVAEGGSTTTTGPENGSTTTIARGEKPEIAPLEGAPPTELQIEDLRPGDGAKATSGSSITVDYVGVTSAGKEFDESFSKEPATFELVQGGLIDGWVQGLEGMQVGGRRRLVIPGDLAYGADGQPPDIGPNETLVFVIDLLAVA